MIQPAENPDMQKAMNAQREKMLQEREIFLRLLTVLVDALVNQKEVVVEEGLVMVPDADFDGAPHKHRLHVVRMKKPEDAPAEAPEVMWGVKVEAKTGTNGKLLAPDRPRLILP